MQYSSAALLVAATVAVLYAIGAFRSDELRRGFDLSGDALFCLGIMLAFTLPVRCRVVTSKGGECKNEAYGVLFGCNRAGRHWSGKFAARLGPNRGSSRARPVPRQGAPTAHHLAPEEALAIVVTVAGGGMGVCAFWFGLIGTAAGVASVALSAAQLH